MRCLNSFGTTNAKKHSKPLGYEPTLELDSILPKACCIIILYFFKVKKVDLFGISVDSKGKLDFKTYYLDSAGNRLKSILNDKDLVIRYVKE